MKIDVNIERLILDGVSLAPSQRPAFQAALEDELGRLLAGGALPSALSESRNIPGVRASEVRLAPNGGAAQWGRQIAQAVYEGLGRTEGEAS